MVIFSIGNELMISKYLLSFVLIFIISDSVSSQEYDKIYLKNKEVYTGKVVRVTSNNIEINIKEGSLKKIKKSEVKLIIYSDNEVLYIENNSTGIELIDNTRFKEFRTDGYYITSHPIEYKYRLIKEKYRRTRSFQDIFLYIAFKIVPEDFSNENYNIQVALFYEKKLDFLRKYSKKTEWKTVHDELLYKEKVNRKLIENKINKEADVQKWFPWDSKVFLIKLEQSSDLTILLSHFTGLKENIPRVNIIIGENTSFFGWDFKSSEYSPTEFYEFFSDVNDKIIPSFTIHKNQELYFVPDSEN